MDLRERIEAFTGLGEVIRKGLTGTDNNISSRLNYLINNQQAKNDWFTPENVRMALGTIADVLTFDNLTKWTNAYPALNETRKTFNIGIIMAGNIPLVGFHDFLSVLITGNNIIAKVSSKDPELISFVSEILCGINPEFKKSIKFTLGTLTGFDGIIATGSDNSSRYFEYYFGKYPHIIRKNRNSIAILEGNETDCDLQGLGKDVFTYFGLGCRNISKIFVPEGYDFSALVRNWEIYSGVINHPRYANNYDFTKAVYIVNKEKFIDTGYLLLKENDGLSSPVATVYYEYFDSPDTVPKIIDPIREKIQCITGEKWIPFGRAQLPALWDYADGIDTIEFILKKISTGIL